MIKTYNLRGVPFIGVGVERRGSVVAGRLKEDLIRTSAMGRECNRPVESYGQLDSEKGVTRPEGSPADKVLRDFTVKRMLETGLTVNVDRVGNIFGRREGIRQHEKTVMIGSHLDSVINGGHLDGALGVFAGIEAVARLRDEDFPNGHPIEVAAFTGEEGSSFEVGAMLGSAVLTGKMNVEEALSIKNTQGRTLGDVLAEIGYKGEFTHRIDDIDAFLELHIEQGPVLDSEEISVGIVTHITGIAWLKSMVTGHENHAGTTPMHLRQDALVAAAAVVGFLDRRAKEMATSLSSSIVGTTGHLRVSPNNINVIPGSVTLGLDIRAASLEAMKQLTDETTAFLKGLEPAYGVGVQVEPVEAQPPVDLSAEISEIFENSATQAGIRFRRMASGAAHDAQNMTAIARTGMIFVPSVKGISHSPMEWTGWNDIEKGVAVLTGALKSLSA